MFKMSAIGTNTNMQACWRLANHRLPKAAPHMQYEVIYLSLRDSYVKFTSQVK